MLSGNEARRLVCLRLSGWASVVARLLCVAHVLLQRLLQAAVAVVNAGERAEASLAAQTV